MAEFSMIFEDKSVGTAEIIQEGLYCTVNCRCTIPTDQVLRAYAESEDGPFCLGVLVPEGKELRLRRRFARSAFPENLRAVTVSGQEGTWHSWSGTVAGVPISDGLTRMAGGIRQVAVPWEPDRAEMYLPFLAHCTPMELQGSQWLQVPTGALEDL